MITADVSSKLTLAGLTTGYEVLRGKMPSSPDKVIAIFETGGSGPNFFMGSGTVEEPAIQIRVRGEVEDYDTPRAKIEQIYQAFAGYGAFTVNSTRYLAFTPLQSPYPLRKDDNRRVEWAVNFLVRKELS